MRQLEQTLHLLAGQDKTVGLEDLIDRIERHLSEEGVPVVAKDGSRIMQTQDKSQPTTQPRPLRRAWVFAGALIAVVVAIGIPVWLRGGGDPGDVVSTPAKVFDMRSDSLCRWFTPQDMDDILAAAQQRAETAHVFEGFTSAGCHGTGWATPGWGTSGGAGDAVFVLVEPADGREDRDQFVGNPLLDGGVSYQRRTNQFAWSEGVDGYLRVVGHEDEILYFGFGVDDYGGTTELSGEYTGLAMAFVNELLTRMNWIGPEA